MAVGSSKVSRQRVDFNHKLSTDLLRKHDLIAFEDLKVRNMVRNHALAKSIADAGWGQLRRFTEYKGKRAGKLVVKVPYAYSTQECCFCGALNQVPLSVRVLDCRGCKKMLDRDFNAAWIVLKRGLAQVGQDMPELKPVETGPLPIPTTGRASPVVEAGTICDGNHATRQEVCRWKPTTLVAGGCHSARMRRRASNLPPVFGVKDVEMTFGVSKGRAQRLARLMEKEGLVACTYEKVPPRFHRLKCERRF